MQTRRAVCVLLSALALPLLAQDQKRVSPHESVSGMVGGKKVSISYGRPSMKGRKIFGALVPYGEVWRLGADEATTFTTDADVKIGSLSVPKGTYALFLLPTDKSWTLIVNKTAKQWGAYDYKQADDLGRVELKLEKAAKPTEQFTIVMEPAGKGAALKFAWENSTASIPVVPAS